jgi:23S rRNA (cytidine2498-2'-O)-methyltransferase
MTSFVMTSQDEFWSQSLTEMLTLLPGARLATWIERGVAVLETADSFEHVSQTLTQNPPIYTRHIFPLEYTLAADEWLDSMTGIAERLKGDSYSIQLRILDPSAYAFSKFELTQWMSEELQKRVFKLDVQNPDRIISAVLKNNILYMGLSRPADNLSAWPGGMRRFARSEEQISRAEFKLLEALEIFAPDFSNKHTALDLGAAPGGWSKILAEKGLTVDAVDPADLSPALRENSSIHHHVCTAQKFLAQATDSDIIVNDMRLDVKDSVKIMLQYAPRLAQSGFMLMTFKLPAKNPHIAVEKGLAQLSAGYANLRAKQLFHNRLEITVYGQKKE